MTESVGTARLDIVVDTSQFTVGVEKAKRSTAELAASAKQAAGVGENATKRQVAALERQIVTLGKSREEIIRWRIEQQTSGKVAESLTAKLNAQVAAVNKSGSALNTYGISAKQNAAALRGVPAQVTDIVTALSSGQRPLTVLIQQGGQLKDMFGGIVPAARALGGAIVGLINPFTVTAALAGGLFLAFKQGSDESAGFRQALALTGNAAGVTTDQLQAMALSISQNVGTQHEAAEALATVAREGRFTAEQIREVAEAAIAMEHATGQSVEETVKQFAKLKDEPVKALLELNEQYHFLTTATYEQIKALEAQGRTEEAVALAIRISSAELTKRAKEVVANAGFMERAWHSLGVVVRQVWDDIRNAGRATTAVTEAQMRIASANSELGALANRTRVAIANGRKFTAEEVAGIRRETARLVKAKSDAQAAIASDPGQKAADKRRNQDRATQLAAQLREEADTFGTQVEKLGRLKIKKQAEVDAAVAAAKKIGDERALKLSQESGKQIIADIDRQIKEAESRGKKKGRKGDGGIGAATARATLQGLKDDLAEQTNALENAQKLLDARFKAGQVDANAYYQELRRITEQTGQVQLQSIQQQIAAIQARKVAGKDAINAQNDIGKLEAKAAQVRLDTSTKLQIIDIKEKDAIEDKTRAQLEYVEALQRGNDVLRADFEARNASITMGRREFEIQSAINEALRDESDERLKLAHLLQQGKRGESGGIDQATYDADVAALRTATEARIKIIRDGYAQEAVLRADARNGAKAALQDFITDAQDVAQQTYDIVTHAFDGLADVLTDFFTTGKANWKDYFDSIAREITQFIIKQQLSKWLASIQSAGSKQNSGDAYGNIIGGLANAYGGSAPSSGGSTGGGFWMNLIGSLFGSKSANGNVFANGMPQAFAYGGVVSRATLFPQSNGRLGLMGEKEPEAILPLSRGRDGKLGVRAEGGSSGSNVYHQEFNQYVQGRMDRTTAGQAAVENGRQVRYQMARTGR